MKNKKFAIVGLIALVVMGVVSVFAIGAEDNTWFSHKGWKSSGKHLYENCGDKSSWSEKLGLPSNATETQIQEVLKEHWEQRKIENIKAIRAKLGLPEDASEEEVIEALQKWRQENKNHLIGFGHTGYGSHKEFWHNKT